MFNTDSEMWKDAIMWWQEEKKTVASPWFLSFALSVTWKWSENASLWVFERGKHKEKRVKRERKKKNEDKHLPFQCKATAQWEQGPESACGSSQRTAAFIRASLTKGGLQYSLRGQWRGPWKLFNWEISESECGVEQCFLSEGQGSVAHCEQSHKAEEQQTNLL